MPCSQTPMMRAISRMYVSLPFIERRRRHTAAIIVDSLTLRELAKNASTLSEAPRRKPPALRYGEPARYPRCSGENGAVQETITKNSTVSATGVQNLDEVTDFIGVGGGIRTHGHWNHNP